MAKPVVISPEKGKKGRFFFFGSSIVDQFFSFLVFLQGFRIIKCGVGSVFVVR